MDKEKLILDREDLETDIPIEDVSDLMSSWKRDIEDAAVDHYKNNPMVTSIENGSRYVFTHMENIPTLAELVETMGIDIPEGYEKYLNYRAAKVDVIEFSDGLPTAEFTLINPVQQIETKD